MKKTNIDYNSQSSSFLIVQKLEASAYPHRIQEGKTPPDQTADHKLANIVTTGVLAGTGVNSIRELGREGEVILAKVERVGIHVDTEGAPVGTVVLFPGRVPTGWCEN